MTAMFKDIHCAFKSSKGWSVLAIVWRIFSDDQIVPYTVYNCTCSVRTQLKLSTFLLYMAKKFNVIQLFCPIGNYSLAITVLREGTPKWHIESGLCGNYEKATRKVGFTEHFFVGDVLHQ